MSEGRAGELLDELEEAISSDSFLGKGQDYLQKSADLVAGSLIGHDF